MRINTTTNSVTWKARSFLLLLAVLFSAMVSSASAQEWRGFLFPTFSTGDSPVSVATGDFNGDGITDLATANRYSNDVSVLLGNGIGGIGDGTFAPQVSYAVGDYPLDVTAGDFNGDGATDLATANASDSVSVLMNNGDGTFTAQRPYAARDYTNSVTTGDFNGDDFIDIVATNVESNELSVFLNTGDGTFAAQVRYAAGNKPSDVTTGDFNSDGISDLAITNYPNQVSVLLGNGSGGTGDGTFATPVAHAAGDNPSGITTGDFNGDGISDLAVANEQSKSVSLFLGIGSGGTGDDILAPQVVYYVGPSTRSVTTGDFNGDGTTDLAAASADADMIWVLPGNEDSENPGTGSGTLATHPNYPAGSYPSSMTTGDFNGDGVIDIVTTNTGFGRGYGDVSVLLGNGSDGTFSTQEATYVVGNQPKSVSTGDFNGDGITDLITANSSSHDVSVLLGNGSGGTGDGTFATHATYTTGSYGPDGVTTGDFNSDGITDIATVGQTTNNGVSVLLGNGSGGTGDGTFAARVTYATGGSSNSITTGDFNSDGITDLATTNSNTQTISVLFGNGTGGTGNGTFAVPVLVAAGGACNSLTTGDFNGDGITDLATANSPFATAIYTVNDVSVLLGNGTGGSGDGTFAAPVNYGASGENHGPRSVTAVDFNGDGITDLATANGDFNIVSVLLGNGSEGIGDGTFAAQINYAGGPGATEVTTGDFNGDGLTDLATVSSGVSVLLNLGFREPSPVQPSSILGIY